LGQGKEKAAEFVGQDPALMREVRERVLAALGDAAPRAAETGADLDDTEDAA